MCKLWLKFGRVENTANAANSKKLIIVALLYHNVTANKDPF